MKPFLKVLLTPIILFSGAAFADKPSAEVLKLAETAYQCAIQKGEATPKTLTVIDYSLPSTEKRMWVMDMQDKSTLFHTVVAHGKNSGKVKTAKFSNTHNSKATSLGLFRTENTYYGSNGYSLRMSGLEKGYNDNAMARAIVIHGAPYVSEASAENGWIGRSWGCPAVAKNLAKPIINTIKEGNLVFAYYPDKDWLNDSEYLNCT